MWSCERDKHEGQRREKMKLTGLPVVVKTEGTMLSSAGETWKDWYVSGFSVVVFVD